MKSIEIDKCRQDIRAIKNHLYDAAKKTEVSRLRYVKNNYVD